MDALDEAIVPIFNSIGRLVNSVPEERKLWVLFYLLGITVYNMPPDIVKAMSLPQKPCGVNGCDCHLLREELWKTLSKLRQSAIRHNSAIERN